MHPRGRYRILIEKMGAEFAKPKCSTFPPFCYYSHDIENETDSIKEFQIIGGGDFLNHNWLLLWLLPPAASLRIQLYILFGFIICIQIGIRVTIWIGTRLKWAAMPGIPIPIVVISTYAIIIGIITQNLDVDCLKIVE